MKKNKLFEEFTERFDSLTDLELVDCFNQQVGNQGWTSAKSSYLAALHKIFDRRGLDYSSIGNQESLSFRNKVQLTGNRVLLRDDVSNHLKDMIIEETSRMRLGVDKAVEFYSKAIDLFEKMT